MNFKILILLETINGPLYHSFNFKILNLRKLIIKIISKDYIKSLECQNKKAHALRFFYHEVEFLLINRFKKTR